LASPSNWNDTEAATIVTAFFHLELQAGATEPSGWRFGEISKHWEKSLPAFLQYLGYTANELRLLLVSDDEVYPCYRSSLNRIDRRITSGEHYQGMGIVMSDVSHKLP
jgi:hypothetical protein